MIGPIWRSGSSRSPRSASTSVFLVSFCFAILGLGVIVLFVPNAARARGAPPLSLRAVRPAAGARVSGPGVAASLLGRRDDQRRIPLPGPPAPASTSRRLFPLLFVGTALAFMLLAVPVGRLADRIGRGRVFLGGYVLLLPVYASLLAPAAGVPALSWRCSSRRVLRSDRRRAGRARVLDARRGPPRERPRRAHHGHEPGALRGLRRLRRAVDVGRARIPRCSCRGAALVVALVVTGVRAALHARGARRCVVRGRLRVARDRLHAGGGRRGRERGDGSAQDRRRAGSTHRAVRPPVPRVPRDQQDGGPGAHGRADLDAGDRPGRHAPPDRPALRAGLRSALGWHLHRPQPLAHRRLRGAAARRRTAASATRSASTASRVARASPRTAATARRPRS